MLAAGCTPVGARWSLVGRLDIGRRGMHLPATGCKHAAAGVCSSSRRQGLPCRMHRVLTYNLQKQPVKLQPSPLTFPAPPRPGPPKMFRTHKQKICSLDHRLFQPTIVAPPASTRLQGLHPPGPAHYFKAHSPACMHAPAPAPALLCPLFCPPRPADAAYAR